MDLEEENPKPCFDQKTQYPLFTPLNEEKAASQLQQLIELNEED